MREVNQTGRDYTTVAAVLFGQIFMIEVCIDPFRVPGHSLPGKPGMVAAAREGSLFETASGEAHLREEIEYE